MMTFNIKIALRNLWKNRTYSLINISGLAISLTCCLLIGIFVWNEWRVDRFHKHFSRIYRVTEVQDQAGTLYKVAVTPAPLAAEMKKDEPEVEDVARVSQWQGLLKTSDRTANINRMLVTENSFFKLFDVEALKGDLGKALSSPSDMVITASGAALLFGHDWANNDRLIGTTVNYNGKTDFRISAVVKDLPGHSSMDFQVLLPLQYLLDTDPWSNKWNSNNFHTYILLKQGADALPLEKRLKGKLKKYLPDTKDELGLQPLSAQYLHSKFDFNTDWGPRSDIRYTKIFIVVGLLLLFIACINFVNLSTARAIKRSMEVGVRKVTGASRPQLFRQFMTESFLFVFVSGILSLMVLKLAAPFLDQLTGYVFRLDQLGWQFIFVYSGLLFIVGLVSGSYPAWMLSSFKPMLGLKNMRLPGKRSRVRQGLVIFQFAISAVMIICTFFMYKQLKYVQERDLGFNQEQLVNVRLNGALMKKAHLFKQELLRGSSLSSVAPSTMTMVNVDNSSYLEWDGQKEEEKFLITHANADPDLIGTLGLKLISGEHFSWQRSNDTATYILNESAVKQLNMTPETVLGREVNFWGHKGKIIGVVKDFHFKPLTTGVAPFLFRYQPEDRYFTMFVKTSAGRTAEALKHIEEVYASFEKDYPIEYNFVNELLNGQYKKDRTVANIILVFSVLTIFIACLGLFGLTIFTIEQKVKEIGIRKVLGASVSHIIGLLLKEHIGLVVVSTLVAVPVAWMISTKWMENYAYRIDLEWTVFVIACLVVTLIATITVSWLARNSARANPVRSLRSE